MTTAAVPGTAPDSDTGPAYAAAVAEFEVVIGLETHVELSTASKMFCGCATTFGAAPNTQVCPVCLGLPGALPVANETAVLHTATIGLALGCEISRWCRFARKNYFYPDMPKNFQISQYDEPLCADGALDVAVDGLPDPVRVAIERVHLEEDTGKTLHRGSATGRIAGAEYSLVDFNRAGIPLVEIVTRPVVAGAAAPDVARSYVTALAELLRSLHVSDVRMEQGSLRCDVNVSLRRHGSTEFGTRTETKNVNSFRSVERAVRFEVVRQAALLRAGQRIVQETRHFSEATGRTSPGRSKEEATDYRYFPEPDLVPIALSADTVTRLRSALTETPAARRARLQQAYGFTDLELDQMRGAGVIDLVEATITAGAPAGAARAIWLNDLAARAREAGVSPAELTISAAQVARLLALVAEGALTATLSRQALEGVLAGEGDVDDVVAARGLAVVTDTGALRAAAQAALAAQPDIADKVRGGKLAAVGALVGAVMKATGGMADAAAVRTVLLEEIGVTP